MTASYLVNESQGLSAGLIDTGRHALAEDTTESEEESR